MLRALFVPLLLAIAACSKPAPPQIEIREAWARSTAEGQTAGAVYATFENKGGADRLLGASTDQAALAMIHENDVSSGVIRMRMVESVDLPAGGEIKFAPGGTHIMLEGLKGPLVKGQRFDVQLDFERTGRKVMPVTVIAASER